MWQDNYRLHFMTLKISLFRLLVPVSFFDFGTFFIWHVFNEVKWNMKRIIFWDVKSCNVVEGY
jgi:hypothetical protein